MTSPLRQRYVDLHDRLTELQDVTDATLLAGADPTDLEAEWQELLEAFAAWDEDAAQTRDDLDEGDA